MDAVFAEIDDRHEVHVPGGPTEAAALAAWVSDGTVSLHAALAPLGAGPVPEAPSTDVIAGHLAAMRAAHDDPDGASRVEAGLATIRVPAGPGWHDVGVVLGLSSTSAWLAVRITAGSPGAERASTVQLAGLGLLLLGVALGFTVVLLPIGLVAGPVGVVALAVGSVLRAAAPGPSRVDRAALMSAVGRWGASRGARVAPIAARSVLRR